MTAATYLGAALATQSVAPRPLSAVDLLVGIRNVPVRVTGTCWEQSEGPDVLFVLLSDGRSFRIVWSTESDQYRVRQGSFFLFDGEELAATGLSREVLNDLGRTVWCRYAEDMQGVANE